MNTSHIRPRCAHQRGQALVFTLAFAVVLCLVVLLLFNNSKLANAKTSLQNAADAAAYSAAVLQARDYNFSAYTNRAMIANQVAVAQFVSINSFLKDASATRKRMDSTPHKFYAMLPASKPRWNTAKNSAMREAQAALNKIPPAVAPPLNRLISMLQKAQQAHHNATMAQMMAVASDVAQKNDPQVKVSKSAFMIVNGALQLKAWNEATQMHPANNATREADRFADAVLHKNSIDGFVGNRAGVLTAGWVNEKVRLCFMSARSSTTFGFIHAGGTQLSADKKRWLALDATSGGGWFTCTWIFPWFLPPFFKKATLELPLPDINLASEGGFYGGSAGAASGKNGNYPDMSGYKANSTASFAYGGGALLPLSGILRYSQHGPGKSLDTAGGLQDYYHDVADPLNKKPESQVPAQNGGATPITIEVERPIKGLRLSSEITSAQSSAKGSQDIRLDDAAAGSVMRTVASAHAYFYRPASNGREFTGKHWQRADNKTELANLFSPYWQARLTETPAAERLASALGQAR